MLKGPSMREAGMLSAYFNIMSQLPRLRNAIHWCPGLLSCCWIKVLTQADLERKGFIWFIGYSSLARQVRTSSMVQGWNHKEILLPGLLPTSCSTTFLHSPGPPCLGMVQPTVAWAFLRLLGRIKKNAPQTCLQTRQFPS